MQNDLIEGFCFSFLNYSVLNNFLLHMYDIILFTSLAAQNLDCKLFLSV